VVAAIEASNADIVALQELNHPAAESIERDLAARYPYQVLQPDVKVGGMGILSRYPLHVQDVTLPPESWLGGPQVVEVDIAGTAVTLFHFHALSTSLGKGGPLRFVPSTMEWSIRERERQAQAIASFAAAHPQPLLAVGDFNTTDQTRAYAIVRGVLGDAWRRAGWGPGGTFPGAASSGSSRPSIAGLAVPMWLVRIDYIFYSDDWQVHSAQIGPWDGVSDHRSLLATLQLSHRDE
jgi:endonuclease/exonuclease/phosphatase (EEP) superfamily protein YafD